MTFETAIDECQTELNLAMIEFDRWASQNSKKLNQNDPDFRVKKQNIKMLKYKLSVLNQDNATYRNTPKLMGS